MKTIKVICENCQKEFDRYIGHYNESIKNGSKQFCSKLCAHQDKNTTVKTNCGYCNKELIVLQKRIDESKTGLVFCSKSCSAKTVQLGRKNSEESKLKTSQTLKNKGLDKICPGCKKSFHAKRETQICCSIDCAVLFKTGILPISLKDVENEIRNFVNINGHVPSSKNHVNWYYSIIKNGFTWNKFIASLGFKPNTQWIYRTHLKCKDGHFADSLSEMMVDNWLFENNINHERCKQYPGSFKNCDFYLPDYQIWVEYFGLAGQHEEYDKCIDEKKSIVLKNNLKFVGIVPENLYPVNNLDKIFNLKLKIN